MSARASRGRQKPYKGDMPSPRRKAIRDAALARTVGRWVDEIERALDAHVDQGRPLSDEAQDVLRAVLESLAREDLADKVVFMDSGTFALDDPGDDEDDGEGHDDWPTELPRAARDASDEDEIPPESPGYSGPLKLPKDLKEPDLPEPNERRPDEADEDEGES